MAKRPTADDLKRMGLVDQGNGIWHQVQSLPKSFPKGSGMSEQTKKDFDRLLNELSNQPVMWQNANTSVASIATPLAIFDVDPIGAPRMTRSDQWKTDPFHKNPKQRQRKPITQYFKFKEKVKSQATNFTLPESQFHVIFILPMPHSWSEKKKAQMNGAPHQQKPDADNMIKALKDTLCKSDAYVWDYRITKRWGQTGKILIYPL